jgi:hypothetical protein
MACLAEQLDETRADQAGTTDDDDLHDRFSM